MGAGAGAGNSGTTLADLKKEISDMNRSMITQYKDLSRQIQDLTNENTKYKEEIESLKEQLQTLKDDALKEEKITKDKEAKYQERINVLERKVRDYLELKLGDKNNKSEEGAQAAIQKDISSSTENGTKQ